MNFIVGMTRMNSQLWWWPLKLKFLSLFSYGYPKALRTNWKKCTQLQKLFYLIDQMCHKSVIVKKIFFFQFYVLWVHYAIFFRFCPWWTFLLGLVEFKNVCIMLMANCIWPKYEREKWKRSGRKIKVKERRITVLPFGEENDSFGREVT